MKKIIIAGFLLAGFNYANAQEVQTVNETGFGIQNGAFMASDYALGSTFLGYRAGYTNDGKIGTGQNNTFVGNQSGRDNTTGFGGVFIGGYSGYNNTTGYRNIFIGYRAGYYNTEGVNNVFTGYEAGYNNIDGDGNTFTGYAAGRSTVSTNYNTFYGYNAGRDNTSKGNTFIGSDAGTLNISGFDNVFLGKGSGHNNSEGFENVFLGLNAGHYIGTGNRNTFIGTRAGLNNTAGSSNIFIGHEAGSIETGSNKLYISTSSTNPLIYGDFSEGKVAIGGMTNFPANAGGVSVSAYKLFVKGGILTEEVRVHLATGWADYVFADDYELLTIPELEKYIEENGHLPNVPSALRIQEDGIELGQMANIQQEKIEELTLYIIQQNKQLESQKSQLEQQQKEIDELKAAVNALVTAKQ